MQEVDDFGQRVAAGHRLAQVRPEGLAGDAPQPRQQQQTLRPDEIRRRIAPAVAASVRAAHVLEHPFHVRFLVQINCRPLFFPFLLHC